MRTSSLLALLAASVFATAAEDGAQIYNSLCGACHGPDGKGLNGLPPLVGSDWPKGAPARSIKIVLNGLTGKVTVNGTAFVVRDVMLKDDGVFTQLTLSK